MATEVIMPKVDMVMESGTFVEWLTKEGGHVNKGDPLFVITTDKAAIDVEAPADGILAGVSAKADDVIPVTEVIAYILVPGEELPCKEKQTASAAPQQAAAPVEAASEAAASSLQEPESGKVRVTPVARRLAREMGIELKQLSGSGPRGRIQRSDVLSYQKPQTIAISTPAAVPLTLPAGPAPTPAAVSVVPAVTAKSVPAIPLPDARRKQVVPLSGPRKIIAERMTYSISTAPHINISLRVDMSESVRLRENVLEQLKAQTGYKVSYTAILARAVATVLPHHPYLNASLSDGNIILWEDVHLGIATSVDENLIVPVIREAQNCNLGQLVSKMADLTERARSRRLLPAEMSGSTFTISNLGMFGIESFNAIINPPESAILAVGRMVDTPVGIGGQVVLRPMMELTCTADHRVADGATVARFLSDLKSCLENPYLLI